MMIFGPWSPVGSSIPLFSIWVLLSKNVRPITTAPFSIRAMRGLPTAFSAPSLSATTLFMCQGGTLGNC
ncbi:hypothetical protein LshimejAT787_1102940 [Lyophyllum shimeji]|uniref:Uncharacterized protein n=1 Tax=Lyophyllum shimeji TaxID=47721 RepID=A0A9P3UP32_LYOSH|nr:hypothetical protein LshimejAT787_1102940 [Lyophyllum shimeji]